MARPFSLDEARTAGVSRSSLRGRAWRRVGSQLYRWSGASKDPWKLLETHFGMLPASTVFVGRTAAWMHGLDVNPADPVQVAVPVNCSLKSRAGLEIRHLPVEDIVVIKGLRATSVGRTLLDLCARESPLDALIAIDMATRMRLSWTLEDMAGKPGSARLRWLCGFAAPAESPMETRLRWLLLSAGLPRPKVQTDLYHNGRFVGRADLYYPSARLVIEFDGGNHRDRLVTDDRRQNMITNAGFRILRFTGPDIYNRPEVVVAQVRGGLVGTT